MGVIKRGAIQKKFKPLADTGNYPGKKEIDGILFKKRGTALI